MAYASIDPFMWRDEPFASLDDTAQLIWLYLLTGPDHARATSMISNGDIEIIAKAMRWSTQKVSVGIESLRAAGMVSLAGES